MSNALAKLFSDPTEQLVYHYCSLPAFEGIIESRCFWAADLRTMNDPREVKGSLSTVTGFLDDLSPDEGSLSSQLLERVRQKLGAYSTFTRYFCSSFTSSRDDLYSWMNYGSRGNGFALGIRKSAYSNFYWHNVTYSDSYFKDQLAKMWQKFNLELAGGMDIDKASTRLAIDLEKAAVSNKHSSWASEKESRLIFSVLIEEEGSSRRFDLSIFSDEPFLKEPRVKFKSSALALRPYIEVGLSFVEDEAPVNALAEVIIGPKNISEVEVIQAFLSENGFGDTTVDSSRCDFR